MIRFLPLCFTLTATCPTIAATLTATPATFIATISAASPGDIVKLADGDYGDPRLNQFRTFSPPLVVDACNTKAIFASLSFYNWTGVNLKCIASVGSPARGLTIMNSHHFVITDFKADGSLRAGMVIGNSDFITVSRAVISHSGSDGIDVAGSHDIAIDHLKCWLVTPTKGAHPDCFQGHGGDVSSPTALYNVSVTWSEAIGETQGFDLYGNILTPTGIHFEHLYARTTYAGGITLRNRGGCLECTFQFNKVEMYPGALHTIQIWPRTQADVPDWKADSVVGNSSNAVRP